MSRLDFHRLEPDDLLEIDRQESQLLWLGAPGDVDRESAAILAAEPVAWTAWGDGRIVACFGISETFPGVQGVAWALLGREIGSQHLALTRFMAREIRECGLERLELLAKANEVEDVAEAIPDIDPGILTKVAMVEPTPECRFALLLGMQPMHCLRRFGAASETYMLFERFG
jgi:hypothetical protein